MSEKIKVLGYCRVSTSNQKEEGTIEIQHHALKEYADAQGFELIKTFSDEGVSGGLENRPALADLFDYLEEHDEVQGVLIYKLDRLARDLYIQETILKQLEKLGKKLFSIKEPFLDNDDPMRRAFRQIIGIFAELEKAFITMRLSGGRLNKARKGKYAGGGVALGYRTKNKELSIDSQDAETIKAIFIMRRRKRMSLWEIAQELNTKGTPTARGGRWYAGTIKYILANPIYKGLLSYKDIGRTRTDLAILPTRN